VSTARDRLAAAPERSCEVCRDSGLVPLPGIIPGTTSRHVDLRYCGCTRGRDLRLLLRAS